jgi:hypothetical protein
MLDGKSSGYRRDTVAIRWLCLRLDVFQKNSELLGTDITSGYFSNEADSLEFISENYTS